MTRRKKDRPLLRAELEAARAACINAAQAAYEDAGIRGLCEEGRWECAIEAMRAIDLDAKGAEIQAEAVVMNRDPYRGPVILALGFRVFFLLGALWAVLMVGVWVFAYSNGWTIPTGFAPVTWHGREMLFGYAGAILAGFLLTAPGNWTGWPMPSGIKLAAFAALWVIGRVIPYAHNILPVAVMAGMDAAFFAALALYLFFLLYRFRLWQNMALPLLLLIMSAANVLSYTGRSYPAGGTMGTEAMLYLLLVVISIMAGRLIPGFTYGRFPRGGTRNRPVLNYLAIGLLIAAAVSDLCAFPPRVLTGLFAAAAVIHAARLYGWYTREIVREPFLWILHLAYAWLVIGLALKGATYLGHGNPMLARHAFTVGTIGTITLGMMCRVTLGHTGRPIAPTRGTILAFGLITAAAIFRVLLPLAAPSMYLAGIKLSAACWMAAFGIYLFQYGPMLFQTRLDGQPG